MTRSMTKTQGAEIPQMYPLKGDHKLPEVSKSGIIQPVPQQPQVKPVLSVPKPVQMPTPVQPVQPVHQVQQEVQPNVNMNVNRNVLANFQNVVNPALNTIQPQPIYPAQTMVQPSLREEGDTSRNKENFQGIEMI